MVGRGVAPNRLYSALVRALRECSTNSPFSRVVIGLSGGVDSALCAVLAVDALSHENIQTVFLPSQYSSEESRVLSEKCAKNLNVSYEVHSIEEMHDMGKKILGVSSGVTDENLQARIRGLVLMGISNRDGALLICAGNKSEIAMGYCTLYGDTCGGFAPIGDVYKSQVYELCRFRNGTDAVIPEEILTREPTAELSPNQKDSDILPPYDELDKILYRFVEGGEVVNENSSDTEKKVWNSLVSSEHKRGQLPPFPKVSSRCFGIDWTAPKTVRR